MPDGDLVRQLRDRGDQHAAKSQTTADRSVRGDHRAYRRDGEGVASVNDTASTQPQAARGVSSGVPNRPTGWGVGVLGSRPRRCIALRNIGVSIVPGQIR